MADIKKSELGKKPGFPLIAPPARFSHENWNKHNRQRYRLADDHGLQADRLLEESERVRDVAKELIHRNKEETEMRLKERINDVLYVRDEIEKTRVALQLELESMDLTRERVQDCLKKVTGEVPKIVERCIAIRDVRMGIDLSHDEVEKELQKEIKTIKGAEEILRRTLEQVNEMMRELRANLYLLNRDLEEKQKVLVIENDCLNMKESNLDLSVYHGTTRLDAGTVTLGEWTRYSEEIMSKAKKIMNASRVLKGYTDALLKELMADLKEQYHATNDAFMRRINETKEAKTKLEMKHFEIARQANEMNKNITELEKAIAEKEGYLALAQTRLGRRAARPTVELVKDEVETRLVNEVVEIREKVSWLQHLLAEALATLRYLLKVQVQLEEDLNIKTNSLKIDEVNCMSLRQGIDYHPF